MAYNAVPTVITGDYWTAGNNNTYVRDNHKAGIPDIFDGAGDIGYALDENIADNLPIGTARQVLQVNDAGTKPEWKGIIGCCLYCNTGYYYYDPNVYSKIPFDSAIYDTGSFWSVDDPDAVTLPYDGVYRVSGVLGIYRTIVGSGTEKIIAAIGPSDKEVKNAKLVNPSSHFVAVTFCYIGSFFAGNDIYLSTKMLGSGVERRNLFYNVTYLGTTG